MKRDLTRRQLLLRGAGAVVGTGLAALGYAVGWEPEWLEVVRRDLPIRDLPASLEGKSLVHVSDLHMGPRVDDSYILDTFATVAALQPDIVVMTGDWISYRRTTKLEAFDRLITSFPHGRLATIGILGNHDYGTNWRMPTVADAITMRAEVNGIRMLRNETMTVEGLTVIGLEDLWGPNFTPPPALLAPSDAPRLALCHNPDAADRPIWDGYHGWILAGHTHGGQCKPPFLPPPILPVENRRYTSGEIAVRGERRLYINRGVGYLIRARFNARPEVTEFRLKGEGVTSNQ